MFNRDPNSPNRYGPPGSAAPGAPYSYAPGTAVPGVAGRVVAREGFLTMSFVWMFLALLLSAGTAALVIANQSALQFVIRNFMILLIAELVLVFAISLGINRLGALPGLAMLFVYAILNGATLSIVLLANIAATGAATGVISAFLGASAIFGAASLYGVVTKRDLTRLGGILFMGLIGLIVVSLVNLFMHSSTVSWLIGAAGVVIFTGLTAFDVQRINNGGLQWIKTRESASVIGALHLYLDFVNLFLMLLRLFSATRD